MGKLGIALGFGAGYVLGSRAGRDRFEQLKQTAVKVAQRPEVQQARDQVKTVAASKLQAGTRRVGQSTAGVSAKLRRRTEGTDAVSGVEAPYPSPAAPPPGGVPADSEVPREPFGMPPPESEPDSGFEPLR